MQVKIEAAPKVFRPFEIKVKIETESDLSDLIEALNHMPIQNARKFHQEIANSGVLK